MSQSLIVLHVEAGRHLYGGARQVLHLLEALAEEGGQVLVCPPGSAIAPAAREAGATVYEIPFKGDLDLAFVLRLKRVIRRERPALVHLHSRRGADVMGGIAAWLAGVPAVVSRRVDNPEPRWWARLKYRLFVRVIAISQGIRRVLLAQGVPAEKVVCVPSAVDADTYDRPCDRQWFQQVFDLPADARVFGVIAQLIPRKGHRYLIEALPAVLACHPEVRVLCLGQGPLFDELAQQVRRAGLEGALRLVGFRDDLPQILPCLEGVVHPAEMEGLGVSLLQAAAAGLPLIGTRVGGIPEVVEDGVTGYLVPAADPAALSAAMNTLLDDPARARAMGAAGRQRIAAAFSVAAMAAGNRRVYAEVLGKTEVA